MADGLTSGFRRGPAAVIGDWTCNDPLWKRRILSEMTVQCFLWEGAGSGRSESQKTCPNRLQTSPSRKGVVGMNSAGRFLINAPGP